MGIRKVILEFIACMLAALTYGTTVESTIDIQTFNASEIQQCIWDEWKITEEYYGGVGWQECQDDRKDICIQFLPGKIIYDGQASEISLYYNQFLAIEDEDALFHGVTYKDLGLKGDYFLILEASYADIENRACPFSYFVFSSDTELIITSGRALYRAEKTREIEIEGDNPLIQASSHNSMCYGIWKITGNVERNEEVRSGKHIGEIFVTSEELNSFIACRIFSVQNEKIDELAKLMDIGDNTYIGCFEFSEDYYWDAMIMKDGMTAILVKGNDLYWAERKSDPVEDGIYHEVG